MEKGLWVSDIQMNLMTMYRLMVGESFCGSFPIWEHTLHTSAKCGFVPGDLETLVSFLCSAFSIWACDAAATVAFTFPAGSSPIQMPAAVFVYFVFIFPSVPKSHLRTVAYICKTPAGLILSYYCSLRWRLGYCDPYIL